MIDPVLHYFLCKPRGSLLAAARGRLARNCGELAGDGEFAAFDGAGEHQAGDGVAVRKQGFNEGFEGVHAGGGDFEEEGVATGEVVALADFFEGLDEFHEAVIVGAVAGHADEGHDVEAEGLAVDVDGVSAEDADLFHLFEPLGGCGGGETDAAG